MSKIQSDCRNWFSCVVQRESRTGVHVIHEARVCHASSHADEKLLAAHLHVAMRGNALAMHDHMQRKTAEVACNHHANNNVVVLLHIGLAELVFTVYRRPDSDEETLTNVSFSSIAS